MVELIPEDKIQEVRLNTDIVELVSEYVQLKKQGRNYFGLCPFHGENTPSFSVSPVKQIYHCFGCNRGGNVFSFIMEIEGVSFQEAVLRLAERAGIDIPVKSKRFSKPTNPHAARMIEAHELLRKLYHHLLVNTKDGQEALEYLISRGITREMIDHFQIGYALDQKDMAILFLKSRGFTEEFLEKAGLAVKLEQMGTYRDRFRGRIIFPIFDNKGNTVAFSGRILKEGQPKYLNSPETLIFQKSKILYNFHHARPHIRKKQSVVIFEGFADCISAYGAGVDNGIATMGTALTEEHVNLIKRNTDRVILCFDSDSAGQSATLNVGEALQNTGCTVEVSIIPDGKDPDEYIQKKGGPAFLQNVIGSRITFMAFKMKAYRIGKNLENEGERLAYIEQILTEIAKLKTPVEQDLYLRKLAEEFSLSLDALKQQLRQKIFSNRSERSDRKSENWKAPVMKQGSKLKPAYYNAERMLIAHMLRDVRVAIEVQEKMKDFSFNVDLHQAIATYLFAYYEEGNPPDLSGFIAFLEDAELRNLVTEIGMIPIPDEISEKELQDYLNHVLKHQIMLKIKEKEEESKRAEREQDFERAQRLAMEVLELRKTL